jgi:prephenate dehydratase
MTLAELRAQVDLLDDQLLRLLHESRPSRRQAWDYFFFVDLEGHQEDEPLRAAVQELRKQCSVVKILGSYPNVERSPQ